MEYSKRNKHGTTERQQKGFWTKSKRHLNKSTLLTYLQPRFRPGSVYHIVKKNKTLYLMNEIEIFKNERFGEVRVAGTSDNPLFCLADVCKILGLRVDAVQSRLTDDPIRIGVTDSIGREQQMNFVNEKNLYKVIMRSDKPQAEPFQDWVCGEVLPSIRKHGA